MRRGFVWTQRRDALLAELRRQGLSLAETARALGCEVAHVKLRVRALGLAVVARGGGVAVTRAVATVPRPAPVRRAGLIDLSAAPSSMELLAARWSEKRRC